jgi:hypothetical protein
MIRLGLENEVVGATMVLTFVLASSNSARRVLLWIVNEVPVGETDEVKLQEEQAPNVLDTPEEIPHDEHPVFVSVIRLPSES